MRPTNTVSNEQQDGRGSSVITPLPAGEGSGEGPVCAFIFVDRMTYRHRMTEYTTLTRILM